MSIRCSFGLILGKCLTLVSALFLIGCTTGSEAAKETLRLAFAGDQSGASATPTNPAFRYLKVTSYGRVSYLVLGYVENSEATGQQAPLEVWYSAKGEVLKTQAGRLVGTVGLETDWREVVLSGTPSWAEVLARPQARSYQRRTDLMPGYRANVLDTLQLKEVTPLTAMSSVGASAEHLAGQAHVRWFQEVASAQDKHGSSKESSASAPGLPPAWFALREGQVVYTLQCLSPSFCLSFEPWAPVP